MEETHPFLLPSGAANRVGKIGFFQDEKGLSSVALLTGTVLASSDTPVVPLYADERGLLAWTPGPRSNQITVLLLHLQHGTLLPAWRTSLELPNWAQVSPANPGTLKISAVLQNGRYHLRWQVEQQQRGGMVRGSVPSLQSAGAIVTLRAMDGVVDNIQDETVAEPDDPALAPAFQLLMVPYLQSGAWKNAPWHTGGAQLLLLKQDARGRDGLYLRHARSDESHEVRDILLTDKTERGPVLSLDGRYLFVRRHTGTCLRFQTDTGLHIDELPLDLEAGEVAVLEDEDGDLIFTAHVEQWTGPDRQQRQRRTIRACRAPGGQLLWTHSVGERILPPDPRTIPGPPR